MKPKLFNVAEHALRCGIMCASRPELPKDVDGCAYADGHDGPHAYVAGKEVIQWENDYDCNCRECQREDPDAWCLIYDVYKLPTKNPRR